MLNIDIIEKPKKNIDREIKVYGTTDIIEIAEVQAIRNAMREHLIFIGLDRANNVRNITLLGIGTTGEVSIDTKEIIRIALMSASEKVVLVHNHPSNNLTPSKPDIYISNYTNQLLKAFHIEFTDHIIVTENEYISMHKAKKIDRNYEDDLLKEMNTTLLYEENKKLEKQIIELQEKLENYEKTNDEKFEIAI